MDPSLHARPHPRRRLRCALLALACGTGAAHAATPPPYLQTQRSFEQRAADLVSRMTLEEKAAQMQNAAPAIPRLGCLPTIGGMRRCMAWRAPAVQPYFHRRSAWPLHSICR